MFRNTNVLRLAFYCQIKSKLIQIKAVRNVPNKKGTGVFYWEPQGAKSWSGYALSAWLENGKPSPALDAFLEKDKK